MGRHLALLRFQIDQRAIERVSGRARLHRILQLRARQSGHNAIGHAPDFSDRRVRRFAISPMRYALAAPDMTILRDFHQQYFRVVFFAARNTKAAADRPSLFAKI